VDIVPVGNPGERVYRRDGQPEAYRPAPTAGLQALASATGGRIVDEAGAAQAARDALGSGPTALQGRARKTTPLSPYILLAAALVLVVIVRRRNFTNAAIALPGRAA
jgi:hypothetical protein